MVDCKGYKNNKTVKNNMLSSQDRVKALLNENLDNETKEMITLDLIRKLKQRCKEIKNIERNNKTLVVFDEVKEIKEIYRAKYDTREMRIHKFRNRNNDLKEYREDLSKALVPYRTLKPAFIQRANTLAIKRVRNTINLMHINKRKKIML